MKADVAMKINKFKESTIPLLKALADESVSIEQGVIKHYPDLNLKAQRLIPCLSTDKAADFSHYWYKYTEVMLREMCSRATDKRREQNTLIGTALADSLIALN